MSGNSWNDASYADGAAVVRWLERRADLTGLDETKRKLIQRWRKGIRASVWAVDDLLVDFHLHLSQLPDEVWLGPPASEQDAA